MYFVSVPCVESGSADDPGRIGPPLQCLGGLKRRHERLGDHHHRQVSQQGNDGCIAAKDRCFGSEGYGPIGTRQRKVSALCLGEGLGQEFEYRIAVLAFVFAKPELD